MMQAPKEEVDEALGIEATHPPARTSILCREVLALREELARELAKNDLANKNAAAAALIERLQVLWSQYTAEENTIKAAYETRLAVLRAAAERAREALDAYGEDTTTLQLVIEASR